MADVLHWTAVEPRPAKPRRPPRRRLRWVVSVLAVLLAAAAFATYTYAHAYQPWEFGDQGQWQGYRIVGVTDGTRETALVDVAPTGTLGWIGTTLRLSGRHSVTLLGSDDGFLPGEITLRWQVDRYKMAASPDTATSKPVVVHPGDLLTVWTLVTRPECGQGDGFSTLRDVSLRWRALGVTHHHVFPVSGFGDNTLPLYLCYPKDALKHLYKLY